MRGKIFFRFTLVLVSLFSLAVFFQNCSEANYEIVSSNSSTQPPILPYDENPNSNCGSAKYFNAATNSCEAMVCIPNIESTEGCPQISNGKSLKTCDSQGSQWSLCESRCNLGYIPVEGTTQPNIACQQAEFQIKPVMLSAKNNQTCSINSTGGVKCWGENKEGQLGQGTTSLQSAPKYVFGLETGVSAVAVGSSHSCALLTGTGEIACWGQNKYGQLGSGSLESKYVPQIIKDLKNASTVVAGANHTCALLNGGVLCWGLNSSGQVGSGSQENKLNPTYVLGLEQNVSDIIAGYNHTCALKMGEVYCWGQNSYKQISGDNSNNHFIPYKVLGITEATAISASNSESCAIINEGVLCWGANNSTPRTVSGLESGVTKIVSGSSHSCAVTGGSAKCWGYNVNGQTGAQMTLNSSGYSDMGLKNIELSGVLDLAAGYSHTCAQTLQGVKCWGSNSNGQLGDGTPLTRDFLTKILGVSQLKNFQLTTSKLCMTQTNDQTLCLGDSVDINNVTRFSPVPMNNSLGAYTGYKLEDNGSVTYYKEGISQSFDVGVKYLLEQELIYWGNFVCGLTDPSREVRCWGKYEPSTSNPPKMHDPGVKYKNLFLGVTSLCGLTDLGQVKCDLYYYNTEKKFLDANTIYQSIRKGYVSGLSGGTSTLPSYSYVCGITNSKQLKCWNKDEDSAIRTLDSGVLYKQFFTSTHIQAPLYAMTEDLKMKILTDPAVLDPVELDPGVSYQKYFLANDYGGWAGCGITSSQDLRCSFGYSYNTTQARAVKLPRETTLYGQQVDFTEVQLTSDGKLICGLKPNGELYCMGSNAKGQLGSNTALSYWMPRPVVE